MSDALSPGLYDLLKTKGLEDQIQSQDLSELSVWEELDKEAVRARLVRHMAGVFGTHLADLLKPKKSEEWAAAIDDFIQSIPNNETLKNELLPLESKALKQIYTIEEKSLEIESKFPDTGLGVSALLTGSSRTPALYNQLQKELSNCDRADWLVSFIKWSGLRPLLDTLKVFTQKANPDGSPRLRIATTSYLGATDYRAIEALLDLPNTEVRVSYDTKRTRLHAKAYLFRRSTEFGSAYIGSANVSKQALDAGLEWTAKVSQYDLPHLWKQAVASFDSHWEDMAEFRECNHENLEELRQALASESMTRTPDEQIRRFFDLNPYDYQRTVLEDIQAEREAGIQKHLVIAATGTGKTMIAAFDYRDYCARLNERPSLLFIAHREEILKQAIDSFRMVLRDGSFGDILTGKHQSTQQNHLFCTVQSWNSKDLTQLTPEHFDYVVLDEAHHGAANSYQKMLKHIKPKSLLGLTATPERSDGKDIRNDFDGRFTHEIRLPEAIDRKLLSPFHYYGVSDANNVDFSRAKWRGGYVRSELDGMVSSNEQRALWVLNQAEQYLNDIHRVKGLGFCTSIKHARFMADFFNSKGVKAKALWGDSPQSERDSIQQDLVTNKINFIFTVDLYNEGVDIPAVDTVLFLRPTESLTVFLQQLGRGLRTCDHKSELTVLDFIAPQHRNFRFARRFQALTSRPELRIDDQVEKGMPYLPPGCFIHLEKRAKKIVLQNIKDSTNLLRGKRILGELRDLQASLSHKPSLQEMMDRLMLEEPDGLYKRGLPSELLREAENLKSTIDPKLGKKMARGLRNLLLLDDQFLLQEFSQLLAGEEAGTYVKSMLHMLIWGKERKVDSLDEAQGFFVKYPGLKDDLIEMLQWREGNIHPLHREAFPEFSQGLNLHGSYNREQIVYSLGKGSFEKSYTSREGVLHVPERKVDAFFVDVNKDEKDYSPTTMYDDYAITQHLFHWQTQARTGTHSATGKRYVNHESMGYTPLLFLRDRQKLSNGLTAPFIYAGPMTYQSHYGNKPISIRWLLKHPLPAKVMPWARRVG
jgi:superfamily II DNA or RNA helicase